MRKVIIIVLVFLSLLALAIRFGSKPLSELLGLQERAGIRVESTPKSKVIINNQELGVTPYQNEELTTGKLEINLIPVEASVSALPWKGNVNLYEGTLTVVNRELTANQSSSSGEVITLEKGKGVTIVTIPDGAEVVIGDRVLGRTPLSVSNIENGEHQFLISKENYLKRSIRATVVEGYNLTLNVDLALSEADLTKLPTIPIKSTQEVIIKDTPTGFLRVRASASTAAKEVARVSPGDTLTLLEEQPNWVRVKLPDGKEGYVSSSYVEKKNGQE